MVLTNFECWAHGDAAGAGAIFEPGPNTRTTATDPFNPRIIASASNGYYGYAFVNDANNNNNNTSSTVTTMDHQVEPASAAPSRCKKRCGGGGSAEESASMDMDSYISTKRCRYDEDELAAQYCNDFFSLPATQMIGTQACLMDYEMQVEAAPAVDVEQPQQHSRTHHHHYQGHLHRSNRDVSRCMMSHMI